jgi:hypothetical protein
MLLNVTYHVDLYREHFQINQVIYSNSERSEQVTGARTKTEIVLSNLLGPH